MSSPQDNSNDSEVFSDMIELLEPSEAPIELQDSEDDFAAFCDAIMMPFESCLLKGDTDLVEVFRVLALARKYRATALEEYIRLLAIQLTRPEAIDAHLTAELTPLRLVELARAGECNEVASAAWDVAMREFRGRKRAMHEMLSLADRVGDPQYVGEAYYEAMLRGHRVWKYDPHLTSVQKERLGAGTASCVEALDNITLWSDGDVLRHFCYHTEGPPESESTESTCSYKFSAPWLAEFIDKGLSHCDIVGRLRIAASAEKPIDFPTGIRRIVGVSEEKIRTVDDCHEALVHRAKQELALWQNPVHLAYQFIQ